MFCKKMSLSMLLLILIFGFAAAAQAEYPHKTVILITHFYANALPINTAGELWPQLMTFILSGYVFKLTVAAVDTGPVYLLVKVLRPYLGLTGYEEAVDDV